MKPSGDHGQACRRVAAHFQERWLHYYALSKLRSDGVFAAAYELLRRVPEPVLDVGCGVGLLPFYLRERGFAQPITGIDLDSRKIQRAQEIAARTYPDVTFLRQSANEELPVLPGSIALVDVLHYLEPTSQAELLRECAARVSREGIVLLRDCPRDRSARFWFTLLGEKFAQAISWNLSGPLEFATRASIYAAFDAREFHAEERPMWGRSPFNNRLFIFKRRTTATDPAAG